MSLATSLFSHVGSGVRGRGHSYFRSRRVKIESITDSVVKATVEGSQLYDVELELDGHALMARCDCPYSTENLDPCKHVWATILAADERQFGAHVVGKMILITEEFDDREDYAADYRPGHRPAGTKTKAEPKPRETWQDHFAAVEREAQPAPTSSQWNSRPQREVEQRLIYLVDIPASITTRKLMLHLGVQPLKKDGNWGATKPFNGVLDIDHLPDPLDRRVLNLLEGADRIAGAVLGLRCN